MKLSVNMYLNNFLWLFVPSWLLWIWCQNSTTII